MLLLAAMLPHVMGQLERRQCKKLSESSMFATSQLLWQMCLRLFICALTLFHISQKPPQTSIKLFGEPADFLFYFIYLFFLIFVFPSPFSNAILQNAHKNRVMETEPVC